MRLYKITWRETTRYVVAPGIVEAIGSMVVHEKAGYSHRSEQSLEAMRDEVSKVRQLDNDVIVWKPAPAGADE